MILTSEQQHAVIQLASDVRKIVMPYFRSVDLEIMTKADNSPVTLADQEAEAMIKEHLSTIAPDIPFVGEESVESGIIPDISNCDSYWLVDPIDGTKSFARGHPDFTVNIGLIHKGNPVFGVVYAPAHGDMYYGGEGIGAFKNGKPIKSAGYLPKHGMIIAGTPDVRRSPLWMDFMRDHIIQKYEDRWSSIKFCMVADGSAHFYPRFRPTSEWDTAASHAILLEVGADIIDYQTKERLQYGKVDQKFENGPLATAPHKVLDVLLPLRPQSKPLNLVR